VAWWSFNGVAVSGFDSAPRGGEMKRRYWERKGRRRGSPKGGGGAQHDGSLPDGRSGGVGRRRKTTPVGRCWVERLLWPGTTTSEIPRKIEMGCQGYRAELKE
jgi:hypothetical protein